MRVSILAVAVLSCVLFGMTEEAHAQCGQIETGCHWAYPDAHTNDGPEQLSTDEHSECKICWDDEEGSRDPDQCHEDCPAPFPEASAQAAAYEDMMQAARRGDILTVLAAGRLIPDHVAFNHERASIQVLGCTGAGIVANLPLRGELALATAAREFAAYRAAVLDND